MWDKTRVSILSVREGDFGNLGKQPHEPGQWQWQLEFLDFPLTAILR
jgi:hypothetical protein